MAKSKIHTVASAIIDIEHDELLTLAQASKLVPGEQPVNPHSLFRWHKYGKTGRDGGTVCMESVQICKKIYTTRGALFAFLKATSQSPGHAPGSNAKRASTDRKARRKQAKRALDKSGV